ncbi:MAG: vWA domain-containing protein [Candidatus Rokuibacteriota bacterium]
MNSTLLALLSALLLTAVDATAADRRDSPTRLSVRWDWPPAGITVRSDGGRAFVAGRVRTWADEPLDVAFLIDVSDTTAAPSSLDVDADGTAQGRAPLTAKRLLDRFLRVPELPNRDNVLAAELRAVRILASRIGCADTRLVLVAFSGDADPRTPDASVVVSVTEDRNEFDDGLELVDLVGPNGMTNFEAALETAHDSLVGDATPGSERRAHVVLLSDGLPTLPYMGNAKANSRAAVAGASRLANAGVRVDTVAIGTEATDDPSSLREMARVGGGVFISARDAASLPELFGELEFSGIEDLSIRSVTMGEQATLRLLADGCFGALVPVTDGPNTISLVARGGGREVASEIEVQVGADGEAPTPELAVLRHGLLAELPPPGTTPPGVERSE